MIPDIAAALDDIAGAAVTVAHANGAGRVFELFVMSSLASGLSDAGFSVWLQRSDGSTIQPLDPDRTFVQRGGAPSGVPAASAGPANASVIGFQWRRRPAWEIWNGVQFAGRSTGAHEYDLAIVPKSVGDALRIRGGVPVGRPRVAIECKDVASNGSLDETRAFVARLYDTTLLYAHHPYLGLSPPSAIHPGSPSGSAHRAVRTYRQENLRTRNIIARQSGFAAGTAPLMAYHRIEPHQNITTGGPQIDALVQSVVAWAQRHA